MKKQVMKKLKVDVDFRFIAIWMIAFVALFLMIGKEFRSYSVSAQYLITAKNQTAAIQQEKIVADIAAFPRLAAFYDYFLTDNKKFSDPWQGLSVNRRQQEWNKVVFVKKDRQSGIVTLSVKADNAENARAILDGVARSWYGFSSHYYDLRDSVSLNLINGPFAVSKIERPFVLVVFLLALAFLVAYLIWRFLPLLKIVASRKHISAIGKKFEQIRSAKQQTSPQTETAGYEDYDLVKSLGLKKDNNQEAKEDETLPKQADKEFVKAEKVVYPNFPEMPKARIQSSAPANLPIADDSILFGPKEMAEGGSEEDFFEVEKKEPTQDEYKKRLNDLLRGGM